MTTPGPNTDGTSPGPARPPALGAALRTIASLTFASRITGLARDAVCSRLFGAGPVWSAFAFAFLLPNLFRRLFGEGALAAAFLPEYTQLDGDDARARAFAGAVLRLLLLTLLAATVLGEALLASLLLTPLAETGGLAYRLALLTLPFAPMVCGSAVLGAMLQVRGRFAVPAASPILMNAAIVAAAAIAAGGAAPERAIHAVAAAVPLAGLAQFGLAWWRLGASRPSLRAPLVEVREGVRRTLRRMAPVAVGMSAAQINALIDGLIASWPVLVGRGLPRWLAPGGLYPLDESANATLFFAQRLYQFPLGVFGVALATAAFPALARAADNRRAFDDTLGRSARLSLVIGVPASIGLSLVAAPLVSALYRGGAFDPEDAARVTRVLLGYAPGVWAFGLTHVLTRAFYARGDTRTPMRIALVSIACNTVLSLILIWSLAEAALAWATTGCAIGQTIALMRAQRASEGSAWARGLPGTLGRTLVVSLLMAGAVLLTDRWGFGTPEERSWSGEALRTLGLVAAGGAVFAAGAWVALRTEMRWLLSRGDDA